MGRRLWVVIYGLWFLIPHTGRLVGGTREAPGSSQAGCRTAATSRWKPECNPSRGASRRFPPSAVRAVAYSYTPRPVPSAARTAIAMSYADVEDVIASTRSPNFRAA